MSCVYFAAILEAKKILPTLYYGPVRTRKYVVVWQNGPGSFMLAPGGPGCKSAGPCHLYQQAALQDWQVGCTLRGASGLHINWAAEKGGLEGCPFLQPAPPFFAARRTAFLCSPPACPSVLTSACAARRQFTFFIWKHDPPARPGGRPSK